MSRPNEHLLRAIIKLAIVADGMGLVRMHKGVRTLDYVAIGKRCRITPSRAKDIFTEGRDPGMADGKRLEIGLNQPNIPPEDWETRGLSL